MSRKNAPQKHAFDEGSIREIYEKFLKPLLNYKPHGTTLSEWHEILFNTKNVEIHTFKVKKDFMMPGLYYETPVRKIQGIGYRAVSKGDDLWIRMDDRVPNQIDVEFLGGKGSKDQVFCLDQTQWNTIAINLEEIEEN